MRLRLVKTAWHLCAFWLAIYLLRRGQRRGALKSTIRDGLVREGLARVATGDALLYLDPKVSGPILARYRLRLAEKVIDLVRAD